MRIRPEDYAIHNAMEDVVEQAVEKVLEEDKRACSCSMCQDDIKAQMLNRLQHRYHPLLTGQPKPPGLELEDLETGLFNKVMLECYKALQLVKVSPRHEHDRVELTNTTEAILGFAVSEILSNQKLFFERDDLSQLMAESLNGLEPAYKTKHKGDAFSRVAEMDPTYIAYVYSAIFHALKVLDLGSRRTS